MLIKQLLWRNGAQYSLSTVPSPRPPPSRRSVSLSFISQLFSSFPPFLVPAYSRWSASITFHLLTQAHSFSVFVSPQPSTLCCHFSPCHTFPCLHPVYLCTGHAGLCLPPLSGVSLPERLTIPSASLLICHPNGGYKREKTTICRGRSSRGRARESVWIATVDQVPVCHRFNLCGAVGAGPDLVPAVICDGPSRAVRAHADAPSTQIPN